MQAKANSLFLKDLLDEYYNLINDSHAVAEAVEKYGKEISWLQNNASGIELLHLSSQLTLRKKQL